MDDRLKATASGVPAAAGVGGVALRQLAGPDDYRAGFELQLATWGAGFEGSVPPSVLKIIQRAGGIAAGAFAADGRMLGFLCGLTGVRPAGRRAPAGPAGAPGAPPAAPGTPPADGSRPELFHWSHMLAVAPEARDLGLGTRLKLYQRELLLPLGVETVEWTYDPLEARNAHLNLNRLGAEVVEYVEEMYAGEMGSELARGLGTDRFVVAWRIAGERVRAVLSGHEGPAGAAAPAAPASGAARLPAAAACFAEAPWIVPAPPGGGEPPLPEAPRVRIEIPERIQDFKAEQPERALAYRLCTRRAFGTYLARGYRVAAFCRDADGRCFYGLEEGRP
jgi:predicted GNAT superfamily acetyltransferase